MVEIFQAAGGIVDETWNIVSWVILSYFPGFVFVMVSVLL